jgi:hypothetical protein
MTEEKCTFYKDGLFVNLLENMNKDGDIVKDKWIDLETTLIPTESDDPEKLILYQ